MSRILFRFLTALARLAVRSGRSKDLEIITLRHHLTVLRRHVDRPKVVDDDRTLLAGIAAALPRRVRDGWIVKPQTLVRWHRRRIARHWTQPSRTPGRPPTAVKLRSLVVEMATHNPTWGYRRITAELNSLGHRVGASTVWRILKQHNVDPLPNRREVTWTQFLHTQAAVACDFATIDTAFLRRYYLLFFIDITTQEVSYAGTTANPTGPWTTQTARNLFGRHADRLQNTRALVRDRGSQFIEDLKILSTPVRTPIVNAFAERWIGSLRRGLLDRTIIWNQRQLEPLVTDYIDHDNEHRPHRSLNQQPPRPSTPGQPTTAEPSLRVVRTTRCDGLINEYRNAV